MLIPMVGAAAAVSTTPPASFQYQDVVHQPMDDHQRDDAQPVWAERWNRLRSDSSDHCIDIPSQSTDSNRSTGQPSSAHSLSRIIRLRYLVPGLTFPLSHLETSTYPLPLGLSPKSCM